MPHRKPPTPEDATRLAAINDPKQRAILLRALERGEEIPDFAWDPLPVPLDTIQTDMREELDHALEQLRPLAQARGMSVAEYLVWMNKHGAGPS